MSQAQKCHHVKGLITGCRTLQNGHKLFPVVSGQLKIYKALALALARHITLSVQVVNSTQLYFLVIGIGWKPCRKT